MNLSPKAEGAARTNLEEGLPQTIEEAMAYIEGKFETAVDGIPGHSDEDGKAYVTLSFGATEDWPANRKQLVWAWLMAAMDMALEVPRNRLSWRMRPSFTVDSEGSIAITSRQVMS